MFIEFRASRGEDKDIVFKSNIHEIVVNLKIVNFLINYGNLSNMFGFFNDSSDRMIYNMIKWKVVSFDKPPQDDVMLRKKLTQPDVSGIVAYKFGEDLRMTSITKYCNLTIY